MQDRPLTINRLGRSEFTIGGWHVAHDEARKALKEIQTTHRVDYPVIWDLNSKLVYPRFYETELRGAIVKVSFTLKHQYMGNRAQGTRRYRLVCEPSSISVLEKAKG
jgi:hypothetical protein